MSLCYTYNMALVKYVESDEQPFHFLIFRQNYNVTSSERHRYSLPTFAA
uniref:Uncharacterized protein n=1 Tax=Heterorhabditis bacteriophora TaxID=37862 RepID=A0A1I7WTP5_HETBA